MSQSLINKLRKARQSTIEVGEFKFKITRPTDLEIVEMRGKNIVQREIMGRYVIGWEGVTELHITADGTSESVAFSPELFEEWIADQPTLWEPICTAIVNNYKEHEARQAEAAKN